MAAVPDAHTYSKGCFPCPRCHFCVPCEECECRKTTASAYVLWRKKLNDPAEKFALCPTKHMALHLRDRLRIAATVDGRMSTHFWVTKIGMDAVEWDPGERAAWRRRSGR